MRMASFAIASWRAQSTALDLSFDGVLKDEARTDKSEFAAECAPTGLGLSRDLRTAEYAQASYTRPTPFGPAI